MKRCLLLAIVVALLVPPPIHADHPIDNAILVGILAGLGTSILIIGLDPIDEDRTYREEGDFHYKDNVGFEGRGQLDKPVKSFSYDQIGMIGIGTGILVGTLSYFYFDGKSKNNSMISNKEFQEAWKRAGKTERLNHRNAQIKPYFSWNPRKSINSSTIHSKVSAKVAHPFL